MKAKDVGDSIKWLAQNGYKYKNEGSAAIALFGYPAVGSFLASPDLEQYVDDYGVPVERVWDAMFDTDATWDGVEMDFSERTMRALAQWVTDNDPVRWDSEDLSYLSDLTDALARGETDWRAIASGDIEALSPEEAASVLGEFSPGDEGGLLLSPVGDEFSEEEVVCAKSGDLTRLTEEFYGKDASPSSRAKHGARGILPVVAVSTGVSLAVTLIATRYLFR